MTKIRIDAEDFTEFTEKQDKLAQKFTATEIAIHGAMNKAIGNIGMCKCIERTTGEEHTMLVLMRVNDDGSVASMCPIAVVDDAIIRRYNPPIGFTVITEKTTTN